MNVADRREFAEAVLIDHDPTTRVTPPGRCNLCDHTRHPCSTHPGRVSTPGAGRCQPGQEGADRRAGQRRLVHVCIQLRDHNFFLTDDHCKAAASLIEAVLERRRAAVC